MGLWVNKKWNHTKLKKLIIELVTPSTITDFLHNEDKSCKRLESKGV